MRVDLDGTVWLYESGYVTTGLVLVQPVEVSCEQAWQARREYIWRVLVRLVRSGLGEAWRHGT